MSCSTPKCTLFAPALIAAVRAGNDPTGAMISGFLLFCMIFEAYCRQNLIDRASLAKMVLLRKAFVFTMQIMIIGLTGLMGSGKGELVKILQGMGFQYVRLSSMVREEARKRRMSEDRETLQDIGNEMRAAEGAGVLARRALERILEDGGDFVVDGIRNPAEIDELRNGFEHGREVRIFGVHTGREALVERILSRAREGDLADREEILAKIDREWGFGEPEDGQQVGKCMDKVDEIIENEGPLEEFREKFLTVYKRMREQGQIGKQEVAVEPVNPDAANPPVDYNRPSKDEYYLDLARSVCRRSTCTKVEMGAVIIRDDQVVATGYSGAPRGTKSSIEHRFCLRKKLGIPSGHRYEICRSVHAEQNAIINAARAGTSLLGGDIYIYGKYRGLEGEEPLDAFPCFICKKMLINCGLERVIVSLKDGGYKVFQIEDWVREWRKNDIIDDKYQYGEKTEWTKSDLVEIGSDQSQ